jgi:hypothetical protein
MNVGRGFTPLCSRLAAGTTESAGLVHQETTEGAESKGQKTNSAELFAELPPTVAGSPSTDLVRPPTRTLSDVD